MIRRLFWFISGVDYRTMVTCPATDRMWAAQLGVSLCLSFMVVLGVSFYAIGYMIDNWWLRLGIAAVVAMTVFMFDRALCQSDWFYQGSFSSDDGALATREEIKQSAWRFVRVGFRFGMSLCLAWIIALFLELAIFADTISDKIERDRVATNRPLFDKIGQFESGLNKEIDQRRAARVELEGLLQNSLTEAPATDALMAARSLDLEQQIKLLNEREGELRGQIRETEEAIQRYTIEMNAEAFGQKLSPSNTGKAGPGPRYEFAKHQKEAFESQLQQRQTELAAVLSKRDDLRTAQYEIVSGSVAQRDQERVALQAKRDSIQARVEAARTELGQLEAALPNKVQEFRQKALEESYFQAKKESSDPLRRIAAYQELKADPTDGATITLFSWMTKLFVIFLEIVPVIAKIFFSPPSVYSAKVQVEIKRERRAVRLAERSSAEGIEAKPEEKAMRGASGVVEPESASQPQGLAFVNGVEKLTEVEESDKPAAEGGWLEQMRATRTAPVVSNDKSVSARDGLDENHEGRERSLQP